MYNNKKNIFIFISLFFFSVLLSQDVETIPDTEDSNEKNQTEVSLNSKEADLEVPFKVSSKSKFKNFFTNLFKPSKKNKSRKGLAPQLNGKEETQIIKASTSSMEGQQVPFEASSGSKFKNFFSNLFKPSNKNKNLEDLASQSNSTDQNQSEEPSILPNEDEELEGLVSNQIKNEENPSEESSSSLFETQDTARELPLKSKFKGIFSNMFDQSEEENKPLKSDSDSVSVVKEKDNEKTAFITLNPETSKALEQFSGRLKNIFNPSSKKNVSLGLDSTDSSDDRVDTDLLEIQEVVYAGKDVLANAGADIAMPPGSWVILDASESTPKSEFLTYEWSFPVDFIYRDDYSFDINDELEFYEDSKSKTPQTIKKIRTQNKYIEIELPFKQSGSKFSLNLKVESEYGKTNESSVSVLFLDPIDPLFNNGFSQGSIQDTSDYQNLFEFQIESEINRYAKTYGDSALHFSIRPNQISLNREFLSIQPLKKQAATAQEIESINSMIFNQCISLGIKNVLDPNRKIPASVQTKKYIQKSKIVLDTLITLKDNTPVFKKVIRYLNSKSIKNINDQVDQSLDSSSSIEIKKKLSIPQLFKAHQKSDVINYYALDTLRFIDTLQYEELEDLALFYNSNCVNDSCGSENALLEGVGQLLTWSIDESGKISFRYYNLSSRLGRDPQWIWKSSSSGLKPDYSETITPSEVMMGLVSSEDSNTKEEETTPRVYLSQDIYSAVETVLSSQIMKKRDFTGKLKERNRRAFVALKKKPIIFAVSLAVITQGVSILMKGEEESDDDLPPTFPPI